MSQLNFLGFDFGASSGRAMLGTFENGKMEIQEIHRFSNDPVMLCGRFVWDLPRLVYEMKQALLKLSRMNVKVSGIGIDTWGVDFGLLDKDGNLLGLPVHYRDARTEGMADEVCKVIPREELFIATKLPNACHAYEDTLKAFDAALKNMGLDYLDLYLIHQPYGDVYGSWRAMEELYREGRIRAIGVSNFYPDRLQDLILHNEVAPAVNQVETHPFHQQTAAAEFMRTKGVQIESWAPFAEGKNGLFSNEVLLAVAARYKKTVAQVVLRWLIQRGVVCIPKSVHAERIAENFDVFGFALDAEDMAVIASLDRPESSFLDHRDPETVEWLSNLH